MQAFTLENSRMTPGVHVVVFNRCKAVSLVEVWLSSEIRGIRGIAWVSDKILFIYCMHRYSIQHRDFPFAHIYF